MKQRTLSIVKPDGVEKNLIGAVISRFEKNDLRVVGLRLMLLSPAEAENFYAVHNQRPFFASLVKFMTSGPIAVMVLEGDNAIEKVRNLMGATDPAKAAAGTIRKDFASDIEKNIVHGSDSASTAKIEIGYFFRGIEIGERCL